MRWGREIMFLFPWVEKNIDRHLKRSLSLSSTCYSFIGEHKNVDYKSVIAYIKILYQKY